MVGAQSHRRPRILVTGFSSFPGAPRNPTERLIAELENRQAELAALGDVRLAVLDVDYRTLPQALSRLGADFAPDIAIHFGLSGKAGGFMLERLARNAVGPLPDNAGHVPEARTICALADAYPPLSGFVHVPPLADDPGADGGGGVPIAFDKLVEGALAILSTVAGHWRSRHQM